MTDVSYFIFIVLLIRRAPVSTLFPYTTLFRSDFRGIQDSYMREHGLDYFENSRRATYARSEEHTSELQSRRELVCRLLLEKKKQSVPTTSRPTPATSPRAGSTTVDRCDRGLSL